MTTKGRSAGIAAAVAAAALGLWQPAAAQEPVHTNLSADFHGRAIGRQYLKAEDVVTATDPQGVVCGRYVVKTAGIYGFMHVYGDDKTTLKDEGATTGDALIFKVNGRKVRAAGPDAPVWTGDGECINVNLSK